MITHPFWFASGLAFMALGTVGVEWPRPDFWDGLQDIGAVIAGTYLVWASIKKAPAD